MTETPTTPDLSLRKKLAFSTVAVFLVFALIEVVLRFAGVQPVRTDADPFVGFAGSTPLFALAQDADGSSQYVTANDKRGYFNVQSFAREKSPNTLRVFCLGGSTTYGRPYADPTSFVGWLRELLPLADPTKSYEVINAGGISYASYRVARLVEEIIEYDADVIVVYTGHNEFLEERTYAEVRDRAPIVRVAIDGVSRTRLGALITRAIEGDDEPVDGRTILPTEVQARLDHSAGLDLYERDDALTANVERHFENALVRMVETARQAGVVVVLVTPASNVASFSPFKSQSSHAAGTGPHAQIQEALEAAKGSLDTGELESAIDHASRAATLDPRDAQAHWLHGNALRASSRFEAAAEAFTRARDEDVCTLRATSAFHDVVRRVASRENVALVDYVEQLRTEAQSRFRHSLVGDNFFLDHVHPTIEGHRLLAQGLVGAFSRRGWIDLDPRYDDDVVAGVTRRVEGSVTQEEHARALANLALTLSWAGKSEDSRRLADRALDSGVEDPTILLMAARHATLAGENEAALGYYRRAVNADPNNPVARSQMGFFLAGSGQPEAAVVQFYLASLMWKSNETYHQQLGFALERIGRPDLALTALEAAHALAPADGKIGQKVEVLRRSVPEASRVADLSPQLTRHATGYPATLHTASVDASGQRVPHGFRVSWFDTGELESFAHVQWGQEAKLRVRWNRAGKEVERVAIP